jgi:predicted ATPase
LVGRDEEVGLLRRAWQQTRDEGRGQAVLISGEPGIGKTALVETLRAQVREDGQSRIAFRCSPYHTGSALYPVIEHLKRLLGWQLADAPEARLAKLEAMVSDTSLPLAETIPLFASLLSLPLPDGRYPPIELSPQQRRQQTQDALIVWMLEEAERCHLLTMCEDLHWADPTTLEFLGLLLGQAPTVPILLVFTTRPNFQPSWPPRSHLTPITLARLEQPQTEVLITRLSSGKALPAQVVKHIVAKTDGVPLYVEELTKTILGSEVLHEESDRYVLAGSLSTVTIPATLQDSLMARLDRFPAVREVVQLGAVLGREFAYEMLRALVEVEEPLLQDGLDRLVDGELLYQRGRPPRARYIFKHALVQDAAYQSLLKRTRQLYHQQVAQLLEERFPETVETQPELLAHHYAEAGLAEKSIPYWFKAGQRAIERSANLEAIEQLARGRALLAEQPASVERDMQELDMCLALGPALMSTKGLAAPEAEEVYVLARQLCQSVDRDDLSFQATWGLWLVYQQRGQIDLAQSATEEVLSLAEKQRENVDYLLQAHHAAWTTQLFVGNNSASRSHTMEGDALYDVEKHRSHAFTYGGHDPGVCAKTTASEALCLLGYADQAVQNAVDGVSLAERLTHPFSLAMARYFVAQVHQYRLEAEIVRSEAQATITMCDSHGFESFRAQATVLLGWATAAGGESESGISQIREGLAAWQSTGTGMRLPYFLALLADALLRVDQTEEGLNVIAECEDLIKRSGETRWQAETVRLKAALMDRAGAAIEDIEATYQRALGIARGQEARLLELRAATSLGQLWHGQGKASEARELLGPLCAWFTEGFDTPDVKRARALLNELS